MYMTLPLIIEPSELASELGNPNLLILDLGKAESYSAAHVPGAIHVAPSHIQLGVPPAPGLLPSKEQLNLLFSRLGLTADSHVVVYDDDGGPWAGRMIWVLDAIGHKQYSFLNGGIHAWLAQQCPVETQVNTGTPSNFTVTSIDNSVTIDKAQLLQAIKDDSIDIWDARSFPEYTGEKAVSARGGHLPGAISYEFTRALDMKANLKLRDLEDVKKELNELGITGEKTIVTHCQTHRRSGLTYVICKQLGWPVQAYAGSWSEWGNDPNTPIETGQ
jgi:thiosulfate/3-mercaptopyruvate sulfurtransferase